MKARVMNQGEGSAVRGGVNERKEMEVDLLLVGGISL